MILLSAGVLLLVCFYGINRMSVSFEDPLQYPSGQIAEFVILYMAAAVSYFLCINHLPKEFSRNGIISLLALGILLRFLMIFSVPVLEVDFYRYLWDGGIVANGYSPYKYAPQSFKNGSTDQNIPRDLTILARENDNLINNINHPQLKTSYPPITQAVFAISYLIKPFSLTAWRFVLFIFDIFTFALIYLVLKRLKIPVSNIAIYWLNPLLIKETFNSGHMDVVVYPFVLACLLMFYRKKYIISFTSLAFAVGVKLWPIILAPTLLRKFIPDRAMIIKYIAYFSLLILIMVLPYIYSLHDGSSGIWAYARSWQNNDSIFRIVLKLLETFLPMAGYHPGHGQFTARILTIIIVVSGLIFINKNQVLTDKDIIRSILIVLSVVFFLSPTQFPWYYIWLLPFLTIIPYRPLLLLTVLMPMYYLRYYYEPVGQYEFYYNFIVWFEYLPVLGWVIYDVIKNQRVSYFRPSRSVS